MCGIAGLVRFSGLRPDECNRGPHMVAHLRHRGPDQIGSYVDRWVSLGHTRLSVIDPLAGRQPMANEDGSIQVLFNGEIYNHHSLADRLRARGHQLHTRCDTEVIAHLYEDEGDDFVHSLNGMFAIAIWDGRRHRLLLVRDRMGVKPLYWHSEGDRVAFGSELKAVLAAGDFPRDLDSHALKDYLTLGYVPAPQTIFRNVQKIEAGCAVACTAAGSRDHRYWDIPFTGDAGTEAGPADEPRHKEAWIERFANLLEDAVALRLEADVPLGAFLSGGVDSTAVVAAMRRHASGPVLTHTVGFDHAACDERAQARRAAQHLGTDHRELMVRADALATAQRLVCHFDEPFASPSAMACYHLAAAARDRVTVALSGDGPDEMLGGYRRYRFDLAESAARSLAPSWLRRSTVGLAGWLYPKADWLPRSLRAKRTLQNLASDDATAHLRSVAVASGELPDLLLSGELASSISDYDPFDRGRQLFAGCRSPQLLNRLLYLDMKTSLADEILTKVDRTSMAVGLEVRVPLLDYRLVELSTRLPLSLKLANGQGKRVLRETVARWAGSQFAGLPKHGFDVPTSDWFRGPLRSVLCDTLLSHNRRMHGWLNRSAIERLVRNHLAGISNHGHALWTLFMLEQWACEYLHGSRPTVAAPYRPTTRESLPAMAGT